MNSQSMLPTAMCAVRAAPSHLAHSAAQQSKGGETNLWGAGRDLRQKPSLSLSLSLSLFQSLPQMLSRTLSSALAFARALSNIPPTDVTHMHTAT